jgi:heme-degrading monooxygenase HmoA
MISVIFDKTIEPGRRDQFDQANATLLALLNNTPGLISVEQFSSLTNTNHNRVVSIAFFQDAAAVKAWREEPQHQELQRRLRDEVLADYRMIVAPVERNYGMFDRAEALQALPNPAKK